MNQKQFFEKIKEVTGIIKDAELKVKIAQLLGISESGAYKKLNSITQLTLDEMSTICVKLNLKLDLFDAKNKEAEYPFTFYCDDLVIPPYTYEQWASNILNHSLHLNKFRNDYHVWSYQSNISYFHLLPFRHLLYFKLYAWNRSSWHIPSDNKFNISEFNSNHALNSLVDKIYDHYVSYESIEIWHVDFLNGLLNQIKYYYQLNIFKNKEDLLYIIKDIRKLIAHLNDTAEKGFKKVFGQKDYGSSLEVYLNYTHTSSSLMFIKSSHFKMIYNQFLHPNFIRSSDNHVCDFAENWLKKIKHQSELISETGELTRNKFFNLLSSKVDNLEKEINVDLT